MTREQRTQAIGKGALALAAVGVVLALIAFISAVGDDDPAGPAVAAAPSAAGPVATPAPTAAPPQEEGPSAVLRGSGFDPRAIYDKEAPGVVTVLALFRGSGGLQGLLQGGQEASGLGSGFVLDRKGEILTNAHVVTTGEGSRVQRAQEVYIEFSDGNRVKARILGQDPNSDVALLQLEDLRGITLDPLPLGRSAGLRVGAPVAAIGSPFGERQSLSVGVISAVDRSIQSLTDFSIEGAIQTDAAINKGNSGGPLVDSRGRVIGINSQIRSESGDGTGVGFAVPIDAARRVLGELRTRGKAAYAYIGVSSSAIYPQLAQRFGLPVKQGAWVQTVASGGPAAAAGLKAGSERQTQFQAQPFHVGGDVITRLAGEPIRDPGDLSEVITRLRPGQTVEVELYRGKQKRTMRVKLAERPATAPRDPRG